MDSNSADQPVDIRLGEELPVEKLNAYLRDRLSDFSGELFVKQFPGGHSNLTYLLQDETNTWVLRRPPIGVSIRAAHDMGREYRILLSLSRLYKYVPRPLLFCGDPTIIGAPFFIMERVEGIILRSKYPEGLTLDSERMRTLSMAFVENLVKIHALDYAAGGLGNLGKPAGYVARQVRGWVERYDNARTDDIPHIEIIGTWLLEHIPGESIAALIHNDYKYDNLVLDPFDFSIRAVLDWEMATIGDPLTDLGTSLGLWVEADDPDELHVHAFGLTMLPGNLTRREIVQRYALMSGRDVARIHFYYIFGLFKIAVILQQIYRRYKAHCSRDTRFAVLIDAVRALSRAAIGELDRPSL